jgi:pyrrolidone-carboxylate peptidase
LQIERIARNLNGDSPDVHGEVRSGTIDPDGPPTLAATLFDGFAASPESFSDDAGCYLCNYLFYRALRRLRPRGVRVGFVHVPPLAVMPLEAQQRDLARLIDALD